MEDYEKELFRSIRNDLDSITDRLAAYYMEGLFSDEGRAISRRVETFALRALIELDNGLEEG